MTTLSAAESFLPPEHWLVVVALLLLTSVLASKASGRFGVPALVLFIVIGMVAGSEGLGGIHFDDASIAQQIGVIALAFILFAGGLDTDWRFVRPSVGRALSLATIGILITAFLVGWVAHKILGVSLLTGLLFGAIVSSTDAAAVFSVLRSRGVKLRDETVATLEVESGSNDPMAVFLTTAFIRLIVEPQTAVVTLVFSFVREMVVGAAAGVAFGMLAVWLINRIRLEQDGLYSVLTISIVCLSYGATHAIGGNGFLAVYVTGIVMGSRNFIQRRSLIRFHDGLAWLMQIVMFLALGLLVFPSQLRQVVVPALIIAAFLIFVARPIAVFTSLAGSKIDVREKALISWIGLRGAVPIVLATFPLLAGLPSAPVLFNVVFFIVFASVIVQGTTISPVARWIGAFAPAARPHATDEVNLPPRPDSALVTFEIREHAPVAGRRLVEVHEWPREALILVHYKGDEFLVPNGGSLLETGDRLIVLTSRANVDHLRSLTERPRIP
jgi:potassium/hydrogen antiporter